MKIWCVEDDADIRDIEVYTLLSTGFEALGLPDGQALRDALTVDRPDLILLDIMLPDEDGIAILRRLRSSADTCRLPVIMATAKGTEYDKIQGLDLGADDYLVKPFGMMEMISRVRAVLRRCGLETAPQILRAGGLSLSREEHTVTADGERVSLTLKEFDLLSTFLARPGTVFTRDRLMAEVWGEDYVGESRTVDMHITTLRQKLGKYGACIRTVRGVGYRFEASEL